MNSTLKKNGLSRQTVSGKSISTGSGKTVLEKSELVTEVMIRPLKPHTGTAFLRAARSSADLAKVNVAVVLSVKEGICEEARIVLGSVAPTLMRAVDAEDVLKGKKIDKALAEKCGQAASDATQPRDGSLRASAEYKKVMAKVLVREAVLTAQKRA